MTDFQLHNKSFLIINSDVESSYICNRFRTHILYIYYSFVNTNLFYILYFINFLFYRIILNIVYT